VQLLGYHCVSQSVQNYVVEQVDGPDGLGVQVVVVWQQE
jgi:hypothetical protein